MAEFERCTDPACVHKGRHSHAAGRGPTLPNAFDDIDKPLACIPDPFYLISLRNISPRCWVAEIGNKYDDHFKADGEDATPSAALNEAVSEANRSLRDHRPTLSEVIDG